MGHVVKLSDNIVKEASIQAKVFYCSIAGQIEHWAQVGKIAEENPKLNFEIIKKILIGLAEVDAGKIEPYEFD